MSPIYIYYFTWRHGLKGIMKGVERRSSTQKIETLNSKLGLTTELELTIRKSFYRSGFHAYTNLYSAARRVPTDSKRRRREFLHGNSKHLVVVLCEGLVRTVGFQNNCQVVVADIMKILREIPLKRLREVQNLKT